MHLDLSWDIMFAVLSSHQISLQYYTTPSNRLLVINKYPLSVFWFTNTDLLYLLRKRKCSKKIWNCGLIQGHWLKEYTLSVRKTFCIPSVYWKGIQNFFRTLYIPLTNHAEACKCKTRLTVKPAQSTNLSISDRVNSSKSDNW